EALTNVAKHANASNVTIDIHTDSACIYWSVVDNGSGIPNWNQSTQQRGNGLAGLQERLWSIGGELTITPQIENSGFGLSARIPIVTAN
ncbi:MAG: sensor histidine kinase, partial [Polynucleobacter sp.]